MDKSDQIFYYWFMDISEPTLLLDPEKCRANIRRMKIKADSWGSDFRPHFKTHNSHEVGRWIREEGITKIAVSSVKMAEYFASDGWEDITVAVTFNVLEVDRVNRLLSDGTKVNLVLDSPETLEYLKNKLKYPAEYFVKVDTGYHRTGVPWDDMKAIKPLLLTAGESRLKFSGFLTHAGHSYGASSREEIIAVSGETGKRMASLKNRFLKQYPDLKISVGDTPTLSVAGDLAGADEIRPGNFIFFDLMQHALGACAPEDIATVLAAPVISKNERRREVVVYGGAVHLSKEYVINSAGEKEFGRPVPLTSGGWGNWFPDSRVRALSQEHAVISAGEELFKSVSIGDLVGIVPVHSCLAANLTDHYLTVEGMIIKKNRY